MGRCPSHRCRSVSRPRPSCCCAPAGSSPPDGERPGAVRVRDGRIVSVEGFDAPLAPSDGAPRWRSTTTACCCPAWSTRHVHVNEPGRTEWEGFATRHRGGRGRRHHHDRGHAAQQHPADGGRRRRCGPSSRPPRGRVAGGRRVLGRRGAGQRPATGWPRCTSAGVVGFKCFLLRLRRAGVPAAGPGRPARGDDRDRRLRRPADRARRGPGGDRRRPAAGRAQLPDFLASRPAAAETEAIGWLLDAVARHRLPGAPGAPVQRRRAAAAGRRPRPRGCRSPPRPARTTWRWPPSRCPTARPSSSAARRSATPPTASGCGRRCADGLIDCVVSDHSPCTAELKRLDTGDFGAAWGGIASVQLSLPVTWTEASRRGHGLAELAGWMAAAPARLAGLAGKGAIARRLRRRLLPSSPRTSVRGGPGPAAAPQPGHARTPALGCAAWCDRPGWPAGPSTAAACAPGWPAAPEQGATGRPTVVTATRPSSAACPTWPAGRWAAAVVWSQRRLLRQRAQPDQRRPGRPRPGRLRRPRQGLRRLGDPAPARRPGAGQTGTR